MAKSKGRGRIRSLVRHTAPGDIIEVGGSVWCVMALGPAEGRWMRLADRRTGKLDNRGGPQWMAPGTPVQACYLVASDPVETNAEDTGDTDPLRGGE